MVVRTHQDILSSRSNAAAEPAERASRLGAVKCAS
jgi:hypothetical protein